MSWIQTFTGVAFDIVTPSSELVRLRDIAHALSMLCRFCGHTREFMSVGEHSVHVASIAQQRQHSLQVQRLCLLHDAPEAYAADLPRPVKYLPGLRKQYALVEGRLEKAIFERFGLTEIAQDHEAWDQLKEIDNQLCATEKKQLLMPESDLVPAARTWGPLPDPIEWELHCWAPAMAEQKFLDKAEELGLT